MSLVSSRLSVAVISTDLGQNNAKATSKRGRFLVQPDPGYAEANGCDAILSAAGINEASPVLSSTNEL